MCPKNLLASVTLAAISLAEGKTVDEIAAMGVLFSQLGETLSTLSVLQENYDACHNRKDKNIATQAVAISKAAAANSIADDIIVTRNR